MLPAAISQGVAVPPSGISRLLCPPGSMGTAPTGVLLQVPTGCSAPFLPSLPSTMPMEMPAASSGQCLGSPHIWICLILLLLLFIYPLLLNRLASLALTTKAPHCRDQHSVVSAIHSTRTSVCSRLLYSAPPLKPEVETSHCVGYFPDYRRWVRGNLI